MKLRSTRLLAMGLAAAMLIPTTGCTLNSLFGNIWTGFGFSIGALPGNLLANIIAQTVGLPTG